MSTRPDRPDPFRLDGRVALVTSATGYLGRAIALDLAGAGATVLLAGRQTAKLKPLGQDIEARGARAIALPPGISDTDALHGFLDTFHRTNGRLDVLVNTEAPLSGKGWNGTNRQDFIDAVATAIAAPFEITRAAAGLLERGAAANGQASVVNIASRPVDVYANSLQIQESDGLDPQPHAGAARAGLLHLTRYLANRLAPRGVRVNAIMPGPLPTPALAAARPGLTDELSGMVPLGRPSMPNDIAHAVRFLASKAADHITGAIIPVDGGCSAKLNHFARATSALW